MMISGLIVLLKLLTVGCCSPSNFTLQNLSRLVWKWNVAENGLLNPEILQEIFITASSQTELVEAPPGYDPIVSLLLQKNSDPQCYAFLFSKGVPVTFYHLNQSLFIKERPIFQVLLKGKNKKGKLISQCKAYFGNLLDEYFSAGSWDQIVWILESFPAVIVPSDAMDAAIYGGNVDIILTLLPRVPLIDASTIAFALDKCQDARLLGALVQRSINPNYSAHGGKLPIVAATSKTGDAVGLIQELIDAGANLENLPKIYEETLLQPDLRQRVQILIMLIRSNVAPDTNSDLDVRRAIEDLRHGHVIYTLLLRLNEDSVLMEFPAEIRLYILQLMMHEAITLIFGFS